MGQPLLDKAVFRSFFKTGSCALIAAVATLLVGQFFVGDPTLKIATGNTDVTFSRDITTQCMHFLAMSGTFVLMFFSYAWMLNAEDILELIGVKRKSFVLDSLE
jgi:hypothetical protein